MTSTEKTFNLLIHVTDCCDKMRIIYFLGPYAMRISTVLGDLPEGITNLEILVYEEDIPRLIHTMQQEKGIVLDHISLNPDYTDTCLKITDQYSTVLDLNNPSDTIAHGCSIYVTPLTYAADGGKLNQKQYIKERYGAVRLNRISQKPFLGFLKIFRKNHKNFKAKIVKNKMHLLRYKYKNLSFPDFFFTSRSEIKLNGVKFSTVYKPHLFLIMYYKRDLAPYAPINKINPNLYIIQPNIPFVNYKKKVPFTARIFNAMIRIVNHFIRKDNQYIIKQRKYFFRTVDRFAMEEYYKPLYPDCKEAYKRSDWNIMGELLIPYLEVVKVYFRDNIEFAFNYELYDYLIDYLFYTKKDMRLCKWLINNRNNAFSYLNYVKSYYDNNSLDSRYRDDENLVTDP